MEGIENYWLFIITSFSLAIAPGPDVLYVLSRGLDAGKKAALSAAAGFSLGNIFHLALLVLGISALIKANPLLMQVIKYAGAAYLIYLGIMIWRSANEKVTTDNKDQSLNNWQIFKQSVLANMLNPKVIIFFLGLFPQFVRTEAEQQNIAIIFLGITFIIITWIVFSSVGLFAGSLGEVLSKKPKISVYISKTAGAILILLAISLIFT